MSILHLCYLVLIKNNYLEGISNKTLYFHWLFFQSVVKDCILNLSVKMFNVKV